MQIHYDKEADALYITLGKDSGERGLVARTERVPGSPVALDYDTEGELFGIEIFDLSICTQTDSSDNLIMQYA